MLVVDVGDVFGCLLRYEAEHVAGYVAHLDLFGVFGDLVVVVVLVDVLERLVLVVVYVIVYLYGLVG